MGSAPAPPRASTLHQSSFRNLRLRFNYRSQMSQLTVTHPSLDFRELRRFLNVNDHLRLIMILYLRRKGTP